MRPGAARLEETRCDSLLRKKGGAFLEKPVRDQLSIERGRIDSQDLRGALLLAPGVMKDPENIFALQLLQGQVGIVDHEASATLAALNHPLRKIVRREHAVVGEDHRALD